MAKRIADWRLPYDAKYITSHYGEMSAFRKANGMQPHSGTDWARPRGTRIPAIAKGTIRLIQFSKVLGWVVVQTAMDKVWWPQWTVFGQSVPKKTQKSKFLLTKSTLRLVGLK